MKTLNCTRKLLPFTKNVVATPVITCVSSRIDVLKFYIWPCWPRPKYVGIYQFEGELFSFYRPIGAFTQVFFLRFHIHFSTRVANVVLILQVWSNSPLQSTLAWALLLAQTFVAADLAKEPPWPERLTWRLKALVAVLHSWTLLL